DASSDRPVLDHDAVTRVVDSARTSVGTLLGTAAYMSPEQARGETADAQSDLFSFGCVLYEMATGVSPFNGKTLALLFNAILNKEPAPIAQLNPALAPELTNITAKALEKDRDLRYRSAADLRTDLKRLRRDVVPREFATRKPRLPQWALATGAAVLLLALAVAGAYVWLRPARQEPVSRSSVFDALQVTQITSSGTAFRPSIS